MLRTCLLLLLLALIPSAQGMDEKDDAKTPESELIWISRPVPGAKLIEKMNSIILPEVEFNGVTLEQALEYLRQQSRVLDKTPGPPESKGVKIVLHPPEFINEPSISLSLKQVPLSEALRYVTELAQLGYRVQEDQVIVLHPHTGQGEIHTRTFRVPPDFLAFDGSEPPDLPADPFAPAEPSPDPQSGKIPRKSAQRVLERAGITFPEGSSARFNPLTGLLKVTNTRPNLDLVEAYCDSRCILPPKVIAFNLTIIEAPGTLIRQMNADASKTADASQHLSTLLGLAQKPGSSVRVAGHALVETRSGIKATTEAMHEPWFPSSTSQPSSAALADSPAPQPSGLRLHLSPIIHPDGLTIDLGLDLELSLPPSSITQAPGIVPPHAETPGVHLTSSLVVLSGSTKLVGVTRPPGLPQKTDDVLWAAFITSSIHYAAAQRHPFALDVPSVAKPPKGMSTIAFRIPPGLFESIMEPSPKPLRDWLIEQGVTFPDGAKIELQNEILHVTTTEENIESLSDLIGAAMHKAAKTVAVTLHTVRLPSAYLPRLTLAAAASNDQSKEWQALEDAAARGEAVFLESCFFETKSGTRSTHESVRECYFLGQQTSPDDKSPPGVSLQGQTLGSYLEIEPTLSADGHIMDIDYLHEMHVDAGGPEAASPKDSPQNQGSPLPAHTFRTLKTRSQTTMINGSAKLIALHQDLDRSNSGHIWATFLSCSVVPQFVKPSPAATSSVSPAADAQALETKSYHVPPDFLQRIPSIIDQPQAAQADPFAPGSTYTQSLEPLGISFPIGASAAFDPKTSTLVIRNTPANHALVTAAIAKLLLTAPSTVGLTTHVLQGPGPLLRRLSAQAAQKSDHRAELDELLAAVKAGTVQHLDTAHLETKPGTRATVNLGHTHKPLSELRLDDKGQPVSKSQPRPVGLNLELEPTTHLDGHLVDVVLSAEYHTAPPLEHREHLTDTQGRRLEFPLTDFFTSRTTTRITIPSGSARLLSLYKPTGHPDLEKQDILQALFITCDILRLTDPPVTK